MRDFAIAVTRYLALCGLLVAGLDLAVRAPWWGPVCALGAACWFALLSAWIRRGRRQR